MQTKLGKKTWLSIVIFSLVGQIAWTMENMFYNLYIVNQFNASPSSIALMVSLSAVTATLTTLFMGALSDKIGKRKIFIITGYFLWGITILSFIFVNNQYISSATLGVGLVVLLDCLMTFFGSSANDAAYNAYLTEISDDSNRGKIEGINSAMPLISILIVFGIVVSIKCSKLEKENIKLKIENSNITDSIKIENEILHQKISLKSTILFRYNYFDMLYMDSLNQ